MEMNLTIENRIEELTKLPEFVDELCDTLGWGPELSFQLNLVLEEAMTNVVMYAYPEGETHEIWLSVWDTDGVVNFLLEDEGKPFDPTQVPDADVTLSAEERNIGGLGIFLIRQLMDSITYEYAGNRNKLLMTKKL